MTSSTSSAWVNARALRDLYKADLMHMIVDDASTCGCADFKGWASVSHRTCTTGFYTFGHEIGHNFVSKFYMSHAFGIMFTSQ
jgi:hypothetical protein